MKPPKSVSTGFAVFELCPQLLRTVEKLEWTTPTPVQLEAIPPALDGHDVIALAQTGTGKTGAYVLPLLEALSTLPPARPRNPYCVILAPTRELVQQIDAQVKALGPGMGLRSMTIFGGVSQRPQVAQLKAGVEIVAATPGRLLDLIGQGVIHFENVAHCVLDEADRMFDMGFIRDLKRILGGMPSRKQTLLFSATMPAEIAQLTREFLRHPREIRLAPSLPPAELSHEVWELHTSQKSDALELLLREDHDSVLVFTRTKHRADNVARRLARGGESVAVLHGNRSQNQRDMALARFKRGEARVLVATDVASRGLDVVGIGLVVNYDTPRDPDDYVHRVGRTARAKRHGCAISFLVEEEAKYIRKIEQLLKQPIARRRQRLPGDDLVDDIADIQPDEPRPAAAPQPRPRPDRPHKPRKHHQQSARSKRQASTRSPRRSDARPASRDESRSDSGRSARRGGGAPRGDARPAQRDESRSEAGHSTRQGNAAPQGDSRPGTPRTRTGRRLATQSRPRRKR